MCFDRALYMIAYFSQNTASLQSGCTCQRVCLLNWPEALIWWGKQQQARLRHRRNHRTWAHQHRILIGPGLWWRGLEQSVSWDLNSSMTRNWRKRASHYRRWSQLRKCAALSLVFASKIQELRLQNWVTAMWLFCNCEHALCSDKVNHNKTAETNIGSCKTAGGSAATGHGNQFGTRVAAAKIRGSSVVIVFCCTSWWLHCKTAASACLQQKSAVAAEIVKLLRRVLVCSRKCGRCGKSEVVAEVWLQVANMHFAETEFCCFKHALCTDNFVDVSMHFADWILQLQTCTLQTEFCSYKHADWILQLRTCTLQSEFCSYKHALYTDNFVDVSTHFAETEFCSCSHALCTDWISQLQLLNYGSTRQWYSCHGNAMEGWVCSDVKTTKGRMQAMQPPGFTCTRYHHVMFIWCWDGMGSMLWWFWLPQKIKMKVPFPFFPPWPQPITHEIQMLHMHVWILANKP